MTSECLTQNMRAFALLGIDSNAYSGGRLFWLMNLPVSSSSVAGGGVSFGFTLVGAGIDMI